MISQSSATDKHYNHQPQISMLWFYNVSHQILSCAFFYIPPTKWGAGLSTRTHIHTHTQVGSKIWPICDCPPPIPGHSKTIGSGKKRVAQTHRDNFWTHFSFSFSLIPCLVNFKKIFSTFVFLIFFYYFYLILWIFYSSSEFFNSHFLIFLSLSNFTSFVFPSPSLNFKIKFDNLTGTNLFK